jgi:hypothetical protein
MAGRIDFDQATEGFQAVIDGIFGAATGGRWGVDAFFPSQYRNLIFEAGGERKVLRLTYDGVEREIEPYSLVYKRRRDGRAAEYFYAYDRTGGQSSGPGLKSFVHPRIQNLVLSDIIYEPRYAIELSKAGEVPTKGYFSRPTFGTKSKFSRGPTRVGHRAKQTFTVECPYCQKHLTRTSRSTALKPHKDPNGYPCAGRRGYHV